MRRFVLGLAGAAVVAACSGGGDAPPPPPTGAMRLNNGSSYDIDEVYVALMSASDWGSNRTSSSIAPGYSLTVGGLAPGSWAVEAVSYGTYAPYFAYGVDQQVVANQTLELTAYDSNFSGTMKVTNGNATLSMTGLYVTISGDPWGGNFLWEGSLPPGEYFVVYDMPQGYNYDVWCIRSDDASSTGTYLVAAHSLTPVTCF